MKVLREETDEVVCRFDFANKAKTQAVVITNETGYGFQGYPGANVWLVTETGASVFYRSSSSINDGAAWPQSIWMKRVKGGYLFKLEEGGYNGAPEAKLFFIGKGKARRIAIAGIELTEVATNQFRVREPESAHRVLGAESQNYYYFKWNGKRLVEYGGKAFSYKKLKAADGGANVLRAVMKAGKIKSAYYRGNGDINLNCISHGDERFNILLRVKGGKIRWTKRNDASDKLTRSSEGGWMSKRVPGGAGKISVSYPSKLPVALQGSGAGSSTTKKA